MQTTDEFIRAILGDAAQSKQISIDDQSWSGFQINVVPDRAMTYLETLEIEKIARQHQKIVADNWRQFHANGMRLWTRTDATLSAFPDMPVLDVARYERVGDVDYLDAEEQAAIFQTLQQIYDASPFEIIFAEPAYMEAKFIAPIDEKTAEQYQHRLIEIAPDILNDADFYTYGDAAEDAPVYNKSVVAKSMLKDQGFWLHWS